MNSFEPFNIEPAQAIVGLLLARRLSTTRPDLSVLCMSIEEQAEKAKDAIQKAVQQAAHHMAEHNITVQR